MTAPTISVTLSKDGTIAIPKKLRKALRLNNGQSLVLRQSGQTIVVEKKEASSARTRAEVLVRQAKIEAAQEALQMTESEAWERFESATEALRKALRARQPNRKRS
nr:hypothetical protein [Chloroflexota bacterium]